MNNFFIAFLLAVSVTFVATPFAKILAKKVGAIDIPKDDRRVHTSPIPRLGGLAIYLGFIVSVLFSVRITERILGLLIGATIIVIMGFFDDIKPLPAKAKLVVQIIAAVVVIYTGTVILRITNPLHLLKIGSTYIEFGNLAYPITLIWIVGITNAINLIDGLDGLAAGVSTIASVTLFAVALCTPQSGLTIKLLTLILAGSTLGFLPFNFNPAKIFMGDTGSLFLGFVLSSVSIMGVMKTPATLAILVPIFAIGLPIFDTLVAMLRRFLSGKSMMEADKGHLHHRLLDIGLSQKQAVLTMYIISAALGMGAVTLVEATIKVALLTVFVVFLLASMGVKYLGLMDIKQSDNHVDL
jgi:UDP-GlcNAc:undecaprenyl-phosphate GlcNAc-1-phosphate transferase